MSAIPAAAKATFGIHAAASGDTAPASPSAPATRSSIMKTSTVARESPIPNAAPPRLLLVASGAPNRMMMRFSEIKYSPRLTADTYKIAA